MSLRRLSTTALASLLTAALALVLAAGAAARQSTPAVVYRLDGDLSLRGVTRRVSIPADITVAGDALRARGEFDIKRSDFKVPATSAFHGTVRVRDRLRISFDIVARRS